MESARRRAGPVRLTARDLDLLAFLAEHRFVLCAHVQALLGVSASAAQARLRALRGGGLVCARRIFHAQPAAHQITTAGLRAIDSSLPRPRVDLRCYQHDVDLAWLWLGAHRGAFRKLAAVISEREMRSRDARIDGEPARHGVRLGGVGAQGRERLHYPDLVLVAPDGQRVAVELELSGKGRFRQQQILAGYGADARVNAVLYLVDDPAVARSIQACARRLGISSLVHVQWARRTQPEAGQRGDRGAQRAAAGRATGATRGSEVAR
jgi:hypothetical protein